MTHTPSVSSFFFFNDTATTEIYTLSLHDALPISAIRISTPAGWPSLKLLCRSRSTPKPVRRQASESIDSCKGDRKSTRLNSSHVRISYAVFCLKKKKQRYTADTNG